VLLAPGEVVAAGKEQWEELPNGVQGRLAVFDGIGGAKIAGYVRKPAGVDQLVHITPGFAQIYWAGTGLRATAHCPDVDGVHQEAGEVDALRLAEVVQQEVVNVVPNACEIQVPQPSPAGHATATAHLLRQVFPGDTCPEDEDDSREGLAVIQRGPTTFGSRGPFGEQWLDLLPEVVREQGFCYENTLQQGR